MIKNKLVKVEAKNKLHVTASLQKVQNLYVQNILELYSSNFISL